MSTPILDKLLQAMQGAKGVPASERAVASVLGALDNSLESKHAVVRHIVEDFALTQKVLKLANSSMYAPFGSGSASVSSALDVLGSEAVLHLVLGADLVSDEELQKDDNLSRTLLASELARNACEARAEDASIATLMVEIGRLMSSKYLPDETAAIARLVAGGQEPQDAATAVLGLSYQALGVELATRWNLPDAIRATIDGTGDPLLVGIARFSSAASALIHEGQGGFARHRQDPGGHPDAPQGGRGPDPPAQRATATAFCGGRAAGSAAGTAGREKAFARRAVQRHAASVGRLPGNRTLPAVHADALGRNARAQRLRQGH